MIDISKEDGDLNRLDYSTISRGCGKRLGYSNIKERKFEVSLEGMHIQPPYLLSARLSNGSNTKDVYQTSYLKFLQVKFGKFLKETIVSDRQAVPTRC